MRKQLNEIPVTARWTNSDYLNYEAQHPPLAYALLAVPERTLSSLRLPLRVMILRILSGLSGVLLLYSGMRRLCIDLGLPDTYTNAVILCVFSCQMTFATIAHVANDWLAVPLTIWSLSMLIRYWRNPTAGSGARMAIVMAAGLLTKAYFLAVLPVVLVTGIFTKKWKPFGLVVIVLLLIAGPWYGRSLATYGTVSGMQEARSGIRLTEILKSASHLDWPALAVRNARRALWTGNNTFRTFSTQTLNFLLILLLVAAVLWAVRGHHDSPEWLTIAHCLMFFAALGYYTALSFLYTEGVADGPSPWYSQVLVPPLFALAFLGCSRAGVAGRALACALVITSAYILSATYFVKLIPLYAGLTDRMPFTALVGRYANDVTPLLGNLDAVSLAPARVVLGLACAVTLFAVAQAFVTVRSLVLGSG